MVVVVVWWIVPRSMTHSVPVVWCNMLRKYQNRFIQPVNYTGISRGSSLCFIARASRREFELSIVLSCDVTILCFTNLNSYIYIYIYIYRLNQIQFELCSIFLPHTQYIYEYNRCGAKKIID